MKEFLIIVNLIFLCVSVGIAQNVGSKADQTAIVRQFVDSYNKHDIDAMMSLVADDIKWFSIDGAKLTTETANAADLRKFLTGYFKNCGSCRSTVTNLRRNGDSVSFLETAESGLASLAVYDVIGGKIVRAYYFPAAKAPEKFDAGLAARLGADEYGMKTYVFAILKTGKTKLSGEESKKVMAGHMNNINRLAKVGKLVLAGPFMENDERRGIFVFDVRTKEEAAALIKTDPAVAAGVFDIELRMWYGSAALLEVNELHELVTAKSFID